MHRVLQIACLAFDYPAMLPKTLQGHMQHNARTAARIAQYYISYPEHAQIPSGHLSGGYSLILFR